MTKHPLAVAGLSGVDALIRNQAERALELALGPSERIQRQLEAADPMRHFRESSSYQKLVKDMQSASEAAAGFTRKFEGLRTWAEPPALAAYREVAKQYEAQTSSFRAIAKSEAQLRNTFAAQYSEFDSKFAFAREAADAFERIASEGNAIRKAAEEIAKWTKPIKEHARFWEQYNDASSWSSLRSVVQGLAKASSEVAALHVDSEEEDEQAKHGMRRDAAVAFSDIVENAATQPTFRQAVDEIVAAIAATEESSRQRFLWLLVVPLLLMLLNAVVAPVGDFYVKKWLEHSSPQAETKAVKQAAREAVTDVQVLSDFRFVSSRRPLVVFAAAGARSPAVAQLRFGQAVRVLKRGGDFTLIAWTGEDKEVKVQGWVFSRYLQRFD